MDTLLTYIIYIVPILYRHIHILTYFIPLWRLPPVNKNPNLIVVMVSGAQVQRKIIYMFKRNNLILFIEPTWRNVHKMVINTHYTGTESAICSRSPPKHFHVNFLYRCVHIVQCISVSIWSADEERNALRTEGHCKKSFCSDIASYYAVGAPSR